MKKISKILMVALIGLSAMAMCVSCAPQSKDGSSVPGTPTGGDGRSTQKSLSDIQLDTGTYDVVKEGGDYDPKMNAKIYEIYKSELTLNPAGNSYFGQIQPVESFQKIVFDNLESYKKNVKEISSSGTIPNATYDQNNLTISGTVDLSRQNKTTGSYDYLLKEVFDIFLNQDGTFITGTTLTKNTSNPLYVIEHLSTDPKDDLKASIKISKK